jgi:hypothetical protein
MSDLTETYRPYAQGTCMPVNMTYSAWVCARSGQCKSQDSRIDPATLIQHSVFDAHVQCISLPRRLLVRPLPEGRA